MSMQIRAVRMHAQARHIAIQRISVAQNRYNVSEVSGNGTVFPDGEVSGTLTVAAASIDTKNTRRDTHLRLADFFDSGNYPDIAFTAEAIRPSGQGVAVTGALTVRGRTRLLSFDAAASVRDDGKVWLDAEVVAVDSLHRPSVLLYPSRRRDAAASMSWGCRERGSRGRTRSASPVSSRPRPRRGGSAAPAGMRCQW